MVTGRVHKYPDNNIDTDRIIPARHCISVDPEYLAAHCLEDLDPEFANRVGEGDIIVAGENFGCGSSRENAPLAIKGAGVAVVVAKSFARIFYRNAINIGLPIIESEKAVDDTENGDILEIHLSDGTITNKRTGREYSSPPFPEVMQDIISAGGMVNYVKKNN